MGSILLSNAKISGYFPFMFNMIEQGSLTVNSLALNFLVFSVFSSESNQLHQAITITIVISMTSTLVNALSTWRVLDHKNLNKVEIYFSELVSIGVVCIVVGVSVSYYWKEYLGIGWLGLGGIFFLASMFYFVRDVLIYLRIIPVLIMINLLTLCPLVIIYYKSTDGETEGSVWNLFQWAFLYPRLAALIVLLFFVVKLRDRFDFSFGSIKPSSQPLLRGIASITVAARVHIPYFMLNAVGLTLFAELYRKFFIMLSPVAQVLQANYAFFLPRKNEMDKLVPSLMVSSVIGMVGVFVLKVFFWPESGAPYLYVFIVLISLLMCWRAYYFVLNRIGKDYSREIYLSSLVVMFSIVYIYYLDSELPDHYVVHIFFINEVVYLFFYRLFNRADRRITSHNI